jgi:histidinol-phosphate phosphatase family protein
MLAKALRRAVAQRPWRRRSDAILLDREAVLVPGAGPEAGLETVELAPGAARAVARARAAGIAVGVVTSPTEMEPATGEAPEPVNARVDELVGPVDVWLECTHDPSEDCLCRKPAPGLIYLAAAALGTRPERCVVVGDSGADVEAAAAAGARSVLIPSSRTSPAEIRSAPAVAASLDEAVDLVLGKAA